MGFAIMMINYSLGNEGATAIMHFRVETGHLAGEGRTELWTDGQTDYLCFHPSYKAWWLERRRKAELRISTFTFLTSQLSKQSTA